jgi:hypothetical protein
MIPWFIYAYYDLRMHSSDPQECRPDVITMDSKGIQSARVDFVLTVMVF